MYPNFGHKPRYKTPHSSKLKSPPPCNQSKQFANLGNHSNASKLVCWKKPTSADSAPNLLHTTLLKAQSSLSPLHPKQVSMQTLMKNGLKMTLTLKRWAGRFSSTAARSSLWVCYKMGGNTPKRKNRLTYKQSLSCDKCSNGRFMAAFSAELTPASV